MPVPLEDVGRRARMELIFAQQRGQTVLRYAYCEVPFKVTRLLNWTHGAAHLILMHSTAGVFGGDELECCLRVESGARVLVTHQSATKVHPSEGRPAIQRTRVIVEPDAELQLYLEPVIPFEDAILRQTTHIDVKQGGRMAFWEGFMAGRIGRGERWKFREFTSETHLFLEGVSTYIDRFRLPTGLERSGWTMSECNYLGTGLYVDAQASTFATTLHQTLSEAGIDTPDSRVAVFRGVYKAGPEFHHCREMFRVVAGPLPLSLRGKDAG